MNFHDVNNLIDEGEGFTIEFKRRISSPEKIARTLISFANTRGGTILFGVDDDGTVVGVESEKSEMEMIDIAGTEFCDPPVAVSIDIVPFDGLDVIVCRVPESRTKPHYYVGDRENVNGDSTRVYIRVNDNTVMASREVVKILRDENPDEPPLTVSIGKNEKRLFDYLERSERITLREFGRLVNISDRRASRILVSLVRAGVIRIHTHEKEEFFTLAHDL
ncbi:MAG TPA: ATP-binding protein [Bacteroidota bacterium]|nr:ATP-binding protein [Bacteroidota bacterium]